MNGRGACILPRASRPTTAINGAVLRGGLLRWWCRQVAGERGAFRGAFNPLRSGYERLHSVGVLCKRTLKAGNPSSTGFGLYKGGGGRFELPRGLHPERFSRPATDGSVRLFPPPARQKMRQSGCRWSAGSACPPAAGSRRAPARPQGIARRAGAGSGRGGFSARKSCSQPALSRASITTTRRSTSTGRRTRSRVRRSSMTLWRKMTSIAGDLAAITALVVLATSRTNSSRLNARPTSGTRGGPNRPPSSLLLALTFSPRATLEQARLVYPEVRLGHQGMRESSMCRGDPSQ